MRQLFERIGTCGERLGLLLCHGESRVLVDLRGCYRGGNGCFRRLARNLRAILLILLCILTDYRARAVRLRRCFFGLFEPIHGRFQKNFITARLQVKAEHIYDLRLR